MSEGQLHFHAAGRTLGIAAAARARQPTRWVQPEPDPDDDRILRAGLIEWGRPEKVTLPSGETITEWWSYRGAVSLRDSPPLMVKHFAHGGMPVGHCVRLEDTPRYLEGVFRVFDGDRGDRVLELAAEHGGLPVSIGFKHDPIDSVWYRNVDGGRGVRRDKATLVEVAIVPESAYAGTFAFPSGLLTPAVLARVEAGMSTRRRILERSLR